MGLLIILIQLQFIVFNLRSLIWPDGLDPSQLRVSIALYCSMVCSQHCQHFSYFCWVLAADVPWGFSYKVKWLINLVSSDCTLVDLIFKLRWKSMTFASGCSNATKRGRYLNKWKLQVCGVDLNWFFFGRAGSDAFYCAALFYTTKC